MKKSPVIVDDVNLFPGHIACSPLSKSEIVVPIFNGEEVFGVIDIDSSNLADFDSTDEKFISEIAKLISKML